MLTFRDVRRMTHAVGFDITANSWPLEPWRNHYVDVEYWLCNTDPDWESLVARGLARREDKTTQYGDIRYTCYRVTDHGLDALLNWLCNTPLSVRRRVGRGETVGEWAQKDWSRIEEERNLFSERHQ